MSLWSYGLKFRTAIPILRLVSLSLFFLATLVAVLQLVRYSRMRSAFPPGLVVAGVPVGGLDQRQAADRLTQSYGVPVELYYGNAVIQVKPANAGFELDMESMMAAADLQRINQPFWSAFWDFLWNRLPSSTGVPIRATVSKDRLRTYLENDVAQRYDQPPSAAISLSAGNSFSAGQTGTTLEIDRSIQLIEDALKSPIQRKVNLALKESAPPRPSLQNLQILLQRMIELSEFDGIVEMYLLDLQSRQEIHFAVQQGNNIKPDIAFTAASTMKLPIMIDTFRHTKEPAPPEVVKMIESMVELSENDPADRLMERIGGNIGPLLVTEDLEAMGLKNSFMAGYFYPGAPLLKRIDTPANQRTDVNVHPDPYNQTTAAEAGMLLDDLYQCADSGGGTFSAVFAGEVSQNECRQMITYLARNRIGVLIQAGLPEGTQLAHKHGWITESDGLIHTMSDVGIAYTPGGNYVLTVYLYSPTQIYFDATNQLVAQLSASVYNYFNLSK